MVLFREYLKRFAVLLAGLALYALGTAFGVLAGSVGTNGWNTVAIGLSKTAGFSFGTAVFAVGVVILIIDYLFKGKLGIGTFTNVFFISSMSDVFLKCLSFLPEASNPALGVFYTLFGQLLIAFATVVYMSPGLGAGPRDTLMVIMGRSHPSIPVGVFKYILEMAALAAGVIMGAPFGIGTVLVIALQASMFQFACHVCRFEPRDVKNEDLADTWNRIKAAINNAKKENIK